MCTVRLLLWSLVVAAALVAGARLWYGGAAAAPDAAIPVVPPAPLMPPPCSPVLTQVTSPNPDSGFSPQNYLYGISVADEATGWAVGQLW
jgi:hypothetical protein